MVGRHEDSHIRWATQNAGDFECPLCNKHFDTHVQFVMHARQDHRDYQPQPNVGDQRPAGHEKPKTFDVSLGRAFERWRRRHLGAAALRPRWPFDPNFRSNFRFPKTNLSI